MRTSRHDLARLLSTVTKATESRNTIPILATVRLVADGNKLAVTATNLDVEMSGTIEAEGALSACIDGRLLSSIVAKVSGDTIDIDVADNTATLKAGRSRYSLPVLPVDDFPTMEAGNFTAEFEANPAALLGDVAFSMSDEQQRYYLNGVYLQPTAVTATNGHKLATVAQEGLPDFEPVIVPSKTVGLAPKTNATVRMSATKIQFVADGVTLTSKIIDGTFPDYERVIPQNNDRFVKVDGAALRAAVERVAIISEEKTPGCKLEIGNEEIVLSVHNVGLQGSGEAVDSVPCMYDGEPLTVGFATHYLAEVLAALPAGEVTIALADAGSPALFTSEAADGMRIVLMPRRV